MSARTLTPLTWIQKRVRKHARRFPRPNWAWVTNFPWRVFRPKSYKRLRWSDVEEVRNGLMQERRYRRFGKTQKL